MKKLSLLLSLAAASLGPAQATNYYVAPTGSNTTASGTGLSPGAPFQTIQYASDRTLPGDTVFVRTGTYANLSAGTPPVNIRRSGTPTQWIVYRNYPGERPLIQTTSFHGIQILDGASYVEINGFRIQGNNRNVTLADATNQPGGCAANGVGTSDARFNNNGITVEGRPGSSTGHPHHVRVINNEIFECGGGGISALQADYVTIENNLVYNNSWYTIYGTSGISIASSWNFDATTGYRTIIRNNRCFGNRLFVPWYNKFATAPCQGITDGNGIIIDTNTNLGYTGRTLVANNLVVNNGGSGIHSFFSNHVDIVNNTAYHNSQSVEITTGEIFPNRTDDAVFQNNILVADDMNVLSTDNRNTNITRTNNLYFGGNGSSTAIAVPGTSPVLADPQFVNPTTDWATADFRLQSTSPAINAGLLNALVSPVDLPGSPRVVGSAPDLGAYEYSAPATAWRGGGTTDWNTAANWTAGVPGAGDEAAIPANAAPYPVVTTGTAVLKHLNIDKGASLTLTGGTLNLQGNLRNSGTLSATAGTVLLSGATTQTLGGSGSTQCWNLTLANVAGADQAGALRIHGVLTPTSGTLTTNGQALTLLADADGSALVNNSGAGSVLGGVTVQRYIDPAANPGLGYRFYSAPVSGSTVADLTTPGFTPEVSQAANYNASVTPGTITPYPTVFGYDQSRVALANSYAPFDRGYVVPAALTTPLVVGRGYAVNIAATQLVDFVGTLTTGNQTLPLTRNAAGTANAADAGWQLLGNPYPSPLDYSLVAAPDRSNLDAAIYVYASASQSTGTYRSYVNGIGNSVLPVGQAFFARVSTEQTSGTLIFRNAQRLTTPTSTAFLRGATDTRPQVQLELRSPTGVADTFCAYADTGTTPAFDAAYDALKLPNTTGLNLASLAGSGESLSIDGRPAFVAGTMLPLAVAVPAAGAYSLAAVVLRSLPAGLDALLTDATTGQAVNLRQQPTYAFSVSDAQAAGLLTQRFALYFVPRSALAITPGLTATELTLYPNPARSTFNVLVPAVAGTRRVQADLLNYLGQVVHRQEATLPAASTGLTINASSLAAGVYTLRLQVGAATFTKRLALE